MQKTQGGSDKIRQFILGIILLAVVIAAVYEFGFARPKFQAANDKLTELYDDSAKWENSRDNDIHNLLELEPTNVEFKADDQKVKIEEYTFPRGIPFQKFHLYVTYQKSKQIGTDQQTYYVHGFFPNNPPDAEQLPKVSDKVTIDPNRTVLIPNPISGGGGPPADDDDDDSSDDEGGEPEGGEPEGGEPEGGEPEGGEPEGGEPEGGEPEGGEPEGGEPEGGEPEGGEPEGGEPEGGEPEGGEPEGGEPEGGEPEGGEPEGGEPEGGEPEGGEPEGGEPEGGEPEGGEPEGGEPEGGEPEGGEGDGGN